MGLASLTRSLTGRRDRGLDCRHHAFQMLKSLLNRQRIHLAAESFASFQRGFQEMPGDFFRQRIRDHLSGALLELHPGWMRQSDPDRSSADEKLDVDGISMAGSDGND